MNNFREEFESRRSLINDKLSVIFSKDNILQEGSRYALMNRGKRLRPILFLEFYKLFKELDEMAFDFACGIELIHNYSLVHDDLPAMDDDEFRRGKVTTHIKYGEDMGILIGDGLLNKSIELVLMAIEKADKKTDFISSAKYLYSQSGYNGMILGQVLDIKNQLNTKDDFIDMYDKKTCGLIKSSCKCGAICSGADEKEIEFAKKFGYHLGLAFQLKDDLLDFEEDLSSNKLTYATIVNNREKIKDLIREHSNKALENLSNLKKDTEFLVLLTNELVNREV
ncbi:polyprenyl synthetase family protein [Lagierella sp.]|uniref:polyprenyl synthetase family protein n=1 Tax=Lagierella sp. TaxID=2849657 RepID=UPI00261C96AF|nr:polyprenyl synthetase family protein [Lagierella sp.]